ncbi:hypothetical protein PDESU_04248 [Pontiella desulfatans]|uniref:F5/8 type C domain-containing protein n=1 Tax=Pontiella desulfatans TaxID=2750659 RepID=A0A6C2U6Y5_PONDE|nr:glycosyl hydrolase [Pontiella desulfatans]VGO15663.1 hypothetical protein PDESU_04248 [Pontiella desulfatans]
MKKIIYISAVAIGLVGSAQSAEIWSATTANTTVIDSEYSSTGPATLSGTEGNLVLTSSNGGFNADGMASTADINTLNGTALVDTDTVTIKLTVDSISGDLRANGVTFGMFSSAEAATTDTGMLIGAKMANQGSAVNIRASYQDIGDTGFFATDAELYDGFTMTLTANAAGYTFVLESVGATSPITVSGTFAGTEFLDHFGSGHFYFSAQKFNTGPVSTTISEASISVTGAEVFYADFNAATEISGSVTANATEANLNAGTAVGSWFLPDVEPGAIISDGDANHAFMFDRVLSGSTSNTVTALFERSVDLAGGKGLVLEMDLYAARQSSSQRIEFSLDDADGNSAYTFVFRMNDTKDFYTLNASGLLTDVTANGTGVNNGLKNPAVDGYLDWGATMIHVKAEISSQPTQAGNRGALLSIDWNGDGDYADDGELLEAHAGPRFSGVTEISSLRISNLTTIGGGAWIDNLSATATVGAVVASPDHMNLAKYQTTTADSSDSDTPKQFATDGFAAQDSRWGTSSAAPHWLAVELATPMSIGSAHLYSGTPWGFVVEDFVLQYYEGGSWIDIPGATVSGNTVPALNIVFDAPVTAQMFRLYTTDGSPRVKELALYPATDDGSMVPFGADLDLNVAKMRQYAYSSVSGNNYPKLAIDGYADDSSGWASANTAGPHDLEIHLLENEAIGGIHLYSGYTDQPGTQVQDFEVAYHDGSGWVLFDGGAVSGNTELNRVVQFNASATTTKIRLRCLGCGQAFVREFAVMPDDGGDGYPLWTDVKNEAPPSESFMDYEDSYYTIENRESGQDLANGWLQVLLNLGTDTYRLRSKASERCFEVTMASTNEGASIVEGTWSTLPHQRWRLEPVGEYVKIVNVWSGLVLGLDGTNVVQQASGPEAAQQWKINYETHYPKRGQASHYHFSHLFKPSWAYRWSNDYEEENDLKHGQYMPMQWGGIGGTSPNILKYQPKWYGRANQTTVLGFNEPDLPDQANMEEATAAYQWPRLERMRLPLAGPVPAAYKGTWRQNYEAIADEEGLRSEYMAMHWYSPNGASSGSPSTLISNMQTLYNTYGKPIWLTEFSTRDFDGTKTSWSRNHNFNFLAEFIWRAESLPWLKKYSVFEWGVSGGDPATTDASSADPTDMNSPRTSLHYNNDSTDPGWEDLAECGLLLAGWDGDAAVRDDKAYIIHNKGRFLRLIDHPASNSVSTADVLNRSATEQFMLEDAGSGKKYITGLSDGRRLSCDGSSVGLAAAGTTGAVVEWELNEYQYGWFYIDHPSTGKRLRITDADAIDVVADSNAYDNLRFRFIKHYLPISLTEVQSLPYAESFEDGIGAWREFDNDSTRYWEVGSGGTPTAAAGPGGASDGNHYLFAEGHDAGGYVTNMVECVFDLGTAGSTVMTFDYHMYGSYIDFLSLDVFDGSTWTSNVWTKKGQQQSGSDDAWLSATVDLSAYAGNAAVTLRFRTANKQWGAADPAIDNIHIDGTYQPFPYAESFEHGFGKWTQSTDDDFDWTRNSGGTDTAGTGPNGASDGSWYLYIEPHDDYNGHNKIAAIEGAFDLSTLETAELSFDYHMYGVNVDYLAVDVSDGTTWTSDVWKMTGAQQGSWSNAVVDLSAYAGGSEVMIRFRAKQLYWHVSDIALDNIRINEASLEEGYSSWAADYGLAGDDALSGADPENGGAGDGYDNLAEFALGMNPTTADAGSRDWATVSAEDGTDWFDYVHYRRANHVAEGLSYWLIDSTSLVESVTATNTQDHVIVGPAVNGYEPVTNRYEADGAARFIKLEIRQD